MTNLSEIYPSYYNVLANPPIIPSKLSSSSSTLDQLKKGWEEFSKSGSKDAFDSVLKITLDSFGSDSINFLELAKLTIKIGLVSVGLGPVAPYLNMFVGFFWPKLFGSNAPSMFDRIMDAVRKMMEQSFEQFTLNELEATINGSQKNIQTFNTMTLVAIGRGDSPGDIPNDIHCPCAVAPCIPCEKILDRVTSTFGSVRDNIEAALPHFKDPLKKVIAGSTPDWNREYITMCLPLYTTVATLDLLLHQSYIQFMERWKLTADGTTSPAYIERDMAQIKATLRIRIKEYTEEVHSTFSKYSPDPDSSKGQLNAYIRYTRAITMQCFDIVAVWPTLDAFDYPLDTEQNLTRIVFNDIVGPVESQPGINDMQDGNLTFDLYDIYNQEQIPSLTRSSYAYNNLQLKALQFQTYQKGIHCYPNAFKATYSTTTDDIKVDLTGGANTSVGNNLFDSFPVLNRVNMGSLGIGNNGMDRAFLYVDSRPGQTYPYGTLFAGCGAGTKGLSENNIDYTNHKMQAIYQVTANNPQSYRNYHDTGKTGYFSTLIPVDTMMLD